MRGKGAVQGRRAGILAIPPCARHITIMVEESDPNAGRPWQEMDLFDLANSIRINDPIEEIADFLLPSDLSRQSLPASRA